MKKLTLTILFLSLSTKLFIVFYGDSRTRTGSFLRAKQAVYQLTICPLF